LPRLPCFIGFRKAAAVLVATAVLASLAASPVSAHPAWEDAWDGTNYQSPTTYQVGGETATWNEYQMVSSDKIMLDGENITDRVGPVMEVNGRALIWGRGFINVLAEHARQLKATFPWATNAFAEWDPAGYATYTYANMLTDWDNKAGVAVPSIIRFYPGTTRGCGSYDAYLLNWRASVNQDIVGPVRKNDKLALDTPACLFFDSEKAYVSARAIAEVFKLRMTYDWASKEIQLFTEQIAEPHLDEINRVPINHNDSDGYYVSRPPQGFPVYPGTLLWAVVAADSTNKLVMRKADDGFSLVADDAYGSVDVQDRWGNLKGRIWPTHFVAYYGEIETNNLTTQMAKDNGLASIVGGAALVLVPEEKVFKMLGAAMAGVYYKSNDNQVIDIKNCMANAKVANSKNPVIGIVFVNPATFPLANRFLNNGIAGCVEHTGFVPSALAFGRW
jgi:hypothetical protein